MRAALVGTIVAIGAAAAAATPATADVKAGVDAWQQGDYARAVDQWRPLAIAGDADAQFNLGQAYKLGRGVPVDMPMALDWFRKAAAQGHVRASDNYGLLLFQQGKREEALPYIRKSADRGEPRAQYILGTALFNGDMVQKDWVMAYALMTRAASTGLAQASSSLTVMDKYISTEQRQKGLAIAADMTRAAAAPEYAAASQPTPVAAHPAPVRPAPVQEPPRRIARADVPPSVAEPHLHGPSADTPPPPRYREDSGPPVVERPPPSAPPRHAASPPRVAMADPPPVEREPSAAPPPLPAEGRTGPPPSPRHAARPPATAAPPEVAAAPPSGKWRVQLGAFREGPRARALWQQASGRIRSLAAYKPFIIPGDVTRLQAGPLHSEADAARLCGQVRSAGYDCVVKGL